MKGSQIGIAVVGSGRIGTLRAQLAAKHPAVNFLAVSDIDPANAKKLAEKAGADFSFVVLTSFWHIDDTGLAAHFC